MISEANQKAIEAAGLSFILGMKIPDVPYQVAQWRREHPARTSPTGTSSPSPGPPGRQRKRRDQVIYYQFRADRARRTLRGIDEQVAKAAKAVAGLAPVKRNRFIQPSTARSRASTASSRRRPGPWPGQGLRHQPRGLPGRDPVTADFVIGSYHRLFEIEKSFRMSKSDLQARPIYHRKRDSIEAHLTIVFAALAVSRWIEHRQAGQSGNSSKPPAATAPSRSRPDGRPSPPPTPARRPPKPSKPKSRQPRCALV